MLTNPCCASSEAYATVVFLQHLKNEQWRLLDIDRFHQLFQDNEYLQQ